MPLEHGSHMAQPENEAMSVYCWKQDPQTDDHGPHSFRNTSNFKLKVAVFVPDCLEIKYGPSEPLTEKDEGTAMGKCSISRIILCGLGKNKTG